MIKNTSLLAVFLLCWLAACSLMAQNVHEHYVDGRVFLKIKNEVQIRLPEFSKRDIHTSENYPVLQDLIDTYEMESVKRPFKLLKTETFNNTYEVVFSDKKRVDKLLESLSKHPAVEYIEKVPIETTLHTPNDPGINGEQWYLQVIEAYKAWDLNKGSGEVVVAVVDDAVLMQHEELKDKFWKNPNEIANNGIDDDNNGVVDDIYGADVADGDGDTSPPAGSIDATNFSHGTHVSGLAVAHTGNGKGIASIGYNVRLMPIKCTHNSSSNSTLIQYGWQGVQYAIAKKADVINISWGGMGYSATYENIVKQAKAAGCVLVAAAGNSNGSSPFYPAAYNEVIGVAAVSSSDQKASFSNYGTWIDVAAPGSQMKSPIATSNTAYAYKSGTSMATPVVAGLCALLKSYNPSLSPDAIMNAIYQSAESIDAQNPSYIGKLGHGRINAYEAMKKVTPNGCITPYEISVNSSSNGNATVNWAAASGSQSYTLRYRKTGTSSWSTKSASAKSYTLTGLQSCAQYEVEVMANCGGENSSYSPAQSFTIAPVGPANYCAGAGGTAQFEWIKRVQVGGLDNSSNSDGGYGEFICKSVSLNPGQAYPISLTPGHAGAPYPESWRIWVDLDQNGSFGSNELLYDPQSPNTGISSGSITLPSSAKTGATRMRVAMKWVGVGDTGAPPSCGTFAYGEVEDYTIYVGGVGNTPDSGNDPAPTPTCNTPSGLGTSSITSNSAMLNWSGSANSYTISYKKSTSSSWSTTTSSTKYKNLIGLSAGTNYQFKIRATCSSVNSDFSNIQTFSTAIATCDTPTGLEIPNVTATTATVAWDPVSSGDSYRVRYRPIGGSSWKEEISDTNQEILTGLDGGLACEVKVQSVCDNNVAGAYTASKTFTTSCEVPTNLAASQISENSIQLSWNNISGATNYSIQYRKNGSSGWSTTSSTGTYKTISGLQAGTKYDFQIKTKCINKDSNYTSIKSYSTATPQCNIPSNLVASNVSSNAATLTWNGTANSYTVQYKKTSSSSWSSTSSTSKSKYISNLSANTTYEFRVKAICSSNSSNYSSSKTFSTSSLPCSVPSNLSYSNLTVNSVTVKWNNVTNASSYTVQYRRFGYTTWQSTTSSGTSKYLSNLSASQQYEFRVKANCGTNSSNYSSNKSFQLITPTCNTPTALSSSNVTSNSAKLSCATVSGATKYYFRYRKIGVTSWTEVNASVAYKNISNLSASTTYEFQVKSSCSSGAQSNYSTAKIFQTTGLSCSAPSNLTVSNIGSSNVTLTWNSVSGASSYNIQFRASGSSSWSSSSATGTSKYLSGLQFSTTYEARIKANCGSSSSSYSTSKSFSTTGSNPTSTPSPGPGGYCDSKGYNANHEWIAKVQIGTISNTSGSNGGYGDYTSKSTDLNAGETTPITLIPGYKSSNYNEYWKVWIDLNQDGDFTDNGELVFTPNTGKKGTVVGSVNIPSTAKTGNTRMRVSMRYVKEQQACEKFNYGEVEDYTVNIVTGGGSTTPPPSGAGSLDYCEAEATKSSSEWIQRVKIGSIDNNSGNNNGYGNFTSKKTSVSPGQSYPITLTPGFKSSAYNEYWVIYVDFNRDGDFNDTGEKAYDAGTGMKTTVNANLLIPSNAQTGDTRMRIAMQYKNRANACGTYNYGEVEDYTLTIGGSGGGFQPIANYCDGKGKNSNNEWIAKVQLGNFSNSSGSNNGYGNYLHKTIEVGQEQSYFVQLTPGFKGSAYAEYWKVWIDWNQDGDFNDALETAYDSKGSSKLAVSGNITVPSFAAIGATRMRVSMKYKTGAGACEEYSYGEVEDYTINVSPMGMTVQAIEEESEDEDCAMSIAFEYTVDGLTVVFNNSFEGNYDEIFWSFGDGQMSDKANPTHTYPANGDYNFTVTLFNSNTGCSQEFEGFVHVFSDGITVPMNDNTEDNDSDSDSQH